MKRVMCLGIIFLLAGCSQRSKFGPEETWVGMRADGFPKWTIGSEIPKELRAKNEKVKTAESQDGRPLCYVRISALRAPANYFDATHGRAGDIVGRFNVEAKSSKVRQGSRILIPSGADGDAAEVIETVVFRLYENGGAWKSSEIFYESGYGKADLFAMKPLKIGDNACTVTYAAQGIDTWTPAADARAAWYAGKQVRLALGQTSSNWASGMAGNHHVLTIVSLEKLTTGEKWERQATSRVPEGRVALVAP